MGFNKGRIFRQYQYSVQHFVLNGVLATTLILLLGGFWVTQRRRALTSNRALSLTLSNMSQGIAMVDAQGNLPVVNERALKLLEAPGQSRLTATGGQSVVERLRALTNSSDLGIAKVELVQDDGRVIEIGSTALPDGGAIHTLTDVTEWRRNPQDCGGHEDRPLGFRLSLRRTVTL